MGMKEYLFGNCESPAEFAVRSGVSKTTIYKLINGKKIINRPTARRILKATEYKVDLYDILERQS